MTDKEFYTALMYCFVEGKPHCTEYCPLIREINCRMMLRDEIRSRKCQAGKDEANGCRQLSLFDGVLDVIRILKKLPEAEKGSDEHDGSQNPAV